MSVSCLLYVFIALCHSADLCAFMSWELSDSRSCWGPSPPVHVLSLPPGQAIRLRVHPLYLMIPGTVGCSYAFMLPVSTPPNSIAFASGDLLVKDMVSLGISTSGLGQWGGGSRTLTSPTHPSLWAGHSESGLRQTRMKPCRLLPETLPGNDFPWLASETGTCPSVCLSVCLSLNMTLFSGLFASAPCPESLGGRGSRCTRDLEI